MYQLLKIRGESLNFIERTSINLKEKFAEIEYFVVPEADYLADHFPNTPMLPGLVMLEIAVQTATELMSQNLNSPADSSFDLDFLENLYVTRRVVPNETLSVKVRISELAPDGKAADFTAEGFVRDEKAMKAKFHLCSAKSRQFGKTFQGEILKEKFTAGEKLW